VLQPMVSRRVSLSERDYAMAHRTVSIYHRRRQCHTRRLIVVAEVLACKNISALHIYAHRGNYSRLRLPLFNMAVVQMSFEVLLAQLVDFIA
jgi:hypothetical protein